MSLLIRSIQISSPLLLLTLIGYFFSKKGILNENSNKAISTIIVKLLLPANIFVYIYDADFKTAFNLKLILFIDICALILIGLMIIVAHRFTNENKKLGALIQVGVWGNFSIYGIPLAVSIYGEIIGATMSITNAFLTPIYNLFSTMLFEHYNGENTSILKQLYKALTTPLSIATLLGILLNVFNIELPTFLYQTLSYLGKSVTAISLINLGSNFNFKIKSSVIKLVIVGLLFKLVLTPMIVIPSAVLLGFRNMELIVIMVFACIPVAISAFSTAQYYKADSDVATSIAVYSYVGCSIIIPLVLTILTSLGLV